MKLEDMFNQRDHIFYTETNKILDALTPTLNGANKFIDNQYGPDKNRLLVWEGITLIDGYINLIGVVNYAPGTTLMFEDKTMSVTKDNADYFQQMIRLGIPLHIVQANSEKQVLDYLISLQQTEPEITTANTEGFDLSKLSKDQLASLQIPKNKTQLN